MRILITGGAGFIGSNLVRALQRDQPDAQLLVVDDFRSGSFANLSAEARGDDPGFCYRGDVIAGALHTLDLPALLKRFDPDVVYHLASITDTTVTDQAAMLRDNVNPFRDLLDWAAFRPADRDTPRRLVWASSAATYGTNANGATPDQRPFTLGDAGAPANVYGFSKWVMENLHRDALAANPEAHLVGLRYFNVFGPGEAHKGRMASMIFQLAQQMLAGDAPRLFAPGDQARDHVHVDDVVACTRAAAQPTATAGVYNVGTGTATTFNAIVDALRSAIECPHDTRYIPNPHAFYQDYTCAELSATAAGLGWMPQREIAGAIAAYAAQLRDKAARVK